MSGLGPDGAVQQLPGHVQMAGLAGGLVDGVRFTSPAAVASFEGGTARVASASEALDLQFDRGA
ncbi:hypothetical protein AB0M48_08265 [Lentzea sp. NPDC051208]|uniref:hypothetical protein n=1 Tax=Lentzea sp. NPDC051208 TaxID=3154642 RepID=UPI00341518F0